MTRPDVRWFFCAALEDAAFAVQKTTEGRKNYPAANFSLALGS